MNNPLLINVTPFKGLLTESKTKPGVFEVTGIMQRAGAKNQNGRIYKREILEDQVREYVENFVKVGNAYGELDHPESAIVSLKNGFGVEPVFMKEGGSIPIVNSFKEILNADTILLGFGLPDENAHSPNENLDLDNFHKGILSITYYFNELSKL